MEEGRSGDAESMHQWANRILTTLTGRRARLGAAQEVPQGVLSRTKKERVGGPWRQAQERSWVSQQLRVPVSLGLFIAYV